jgi:hypothetical protein
MGLAMMAAAVNRRFLTVEARVQSQTSACGICFGHATPSTSVCLYHCHSTIAPYLSIYLSVTDALIVL